MKKARIVYGVGRNDSTEPVSDLIDGRYVLHISYRMWKGFLERCYADTDRYPTYKGCTVHEDWHFYSNFKKWFEEHYKEGYVLDKDMKVLGNKVYGPETCVFVPAWLNTFLNPHTNERGKYMIGVSKDRGKFVANCSNIYLGTYSTELEAHLAWKECKLGILLENKDFINSLSENLYDTLVVAVNSFK